MKLQHFVAPIKEAQKLRDLGKALQHSAKGATMSVAEAKKPTVVASKKVEMDDIHTDGMDAAIHTMTQDHKHLHKKLAHHD